MALNDPLPAQPDTSVVAAAMNSRIEAAYRSADTRTRVAADLASLWVKSLLIVNGGAIVGLTSLMTNKPAAITDPDAIPWALGCFAGSAFVTLIALIVGYIGQANMVDDDERLAERFVADVFKGSPPVYIERKTAMSWMSALTFATASLGLLATGLTLAIRAIAP